MTREEAKETDLMRLEAQWADGTKEYAVSKLKVYRLIDAIYKDFESRTCENCKYLNEYERCVLNVNNGSSITNGIANEQMNSFGCNKFERKD